MTHMSNNDMDDGALMLIRSLAESSKNTDTRDTWYCIASCAFAACNQGKYVADVYRAALSSSTETEQQHHILRRIKESLLKTGIIYGIPRVINAFRALITALPSLEANETVSIREHVNVPGDMDERGLEYMRNIFRADLDPFLETMETYWPDLRTLVVTTIYGYYQSDVSVVNAVTTSMLNIATLITMDVPSEVGWHMRGLMRNGGSAQQLAWVVSTTMDILQVCDIRLRNEMPTAQDVVDAERLF